MSGSDRQSTFSGTKEVAERLRFDVGALESYLGAQVPGFAGPAAIYLFTRAVILLGAGRAALYPSLVPPFSLVVGFLALGEVPSLAQLAGLAIVVVGFRLTQ